MNTKQVVQSSANVIRITNVAVGNLYKRFELEGYGSDETIFGIVNNIYNDGESTIIQATEYTAGYNNISVKFKNITSKKEVIIFPASIEEFQLEFDELKEKLQKDVETKKQEILNLQKQISDLGNLISGETQKKLSAMSYFELSQKEYHDKKKAILEAQNGI